MEHTVSQWMQHVKNASPRSSKLLQSLQSKRFIQNPDASQNNLTASEIEKIDNITRRIKDSKQTMTRSEKQHRIQQIRNSLQGMSVLGNSPIPRNTNVAPSGSRNANAPLSVIGNANLVNGGPRNGNVAPGGPRNANVAPGGPQNTNVAPGGPRNGNVAPGGPKNGNVAPGGPRNGNVAPGGPMNGNVAPGGPQNGNVTLSVTGNSIAVSTSPRNANVDPTGSRNTTQHPFAPIHEPAIMEGVCGIINNSNTCFMISAIHFLFRIDTFVALLDSFPSLDDIEAIVRDESSIAPLQMKKDTINREMVNLKESMNKNVKDDSLLDRYIELEDELQKTFNELNAITTCNKEDFNTGKILLKIFKNILIEYRKRVLSKESLDLHTLLYDDGRKQIPYDEKLFELVIADSTYGEQIDSSDFIQRVLEKIFCINPFSDNLIQSLVISIIKTLTCENGKEHKEIGNFPGFPKVSPKSDTEYTFQKLLEQGLTDNDQVQNEFCGTPISKGARKEKMRLQQLLNTTYKLDLKGKANETKKEKEQRIQENDVKQKERRKITKQIDEINASIVGKVATSKMEISLHPKNKYVIFDIAQFEKGEADSIIKRNIVDFTLTLQNKGYRPKAVILHTGKVTGGHYRIFIFENGKFAYEINDDKVKTKNEEEVHKDMVKNATSILFEQIQADSGKSFQSMNGNVHSSEGSAKGNVKGNLQKNLQGSVQVNAKKNVKGATSLTRSNKVANTKANKIPTQLEGAHAHIVQSAAKLKEQKQTLRSLATQLAEYKGDKTGKTFLLKKTIALKKQVQVSENMLKKEIHLFKAQRKKLRGVTQKKKIDA